MAAQRNADSSVETVGWQPCPRSGGKRAHPCFPLLAVRTTSMDTLEREAVRDAYLEDVPAELPDLAPEDRLAASPPASPMWSPSPCLRSPREVTQQRNSLAARASSTEEAGSNPTSRPHPTPEMRQQPLCTGERPDGTGRTAPNDLPARVEACRAGHWAAGGRGRTGCSDQRRRALLTRRLPVAQPGGLGDDLRAAWLQPSSGFAGSTQQSHRFSGGFQESTALDQNWDTG